MSTTLTGAPVSPGRAAGVVVTMPAPVPEPPEVTTGTSGATGADDAVARLGAATSAVRDRLASQAEQATGTAADVLAVTAAMAADPTLASGAEQRVRESVPSARVIYLEPDIYVDPNEQSPPTDAIVIKGLE